MAARLRELAASEDPRRHQSLNRARARLFSELPEERDPRARLLREGLVARELLFAGEPEEAAARFLRVRREIVSTGAEPAPGFRETLDEFLALSHLHLAMREGCPRPAPPGEVQCLIHVPPRERRETGPAAEAAIQGYRDLLAARPEELRFRWLLNLAAMAAGEWPAGLDARERVPSEAFREEHDPGPFRDVATDLGLDVPGLAGGGVVDDLTGDGRLDVMVSSQGLWDPLRVFFQEADGTFREATSEAGLDGLVGGLNLVQADYDNDGHTDVLVLRGGWMERGYPNSLLRNNGDGTFTDVTEAAGILSEHPTQTAAWADYDGDGWLDLFVGNESRDGLSHASELYRNQGDGTFREVSAEVGLRVVGFVKAVVWGDYDNDGRPDLYVSRLNQPNLLFRNEGPGPDGDWRFRDVTAEAAVAEPITSFPAWFWDYDNDGWLDLFVSGYRAQVGDLAAELLGRPHGAERPRLYRNRGDGTFEDVTRELGLDRVLYTMGANFGDLDNDGWLDFYAGTGDPDLRQLMPNRMFRNAEGRGFQEVTAGGGFGTLDKGHAVSFADVDGDGDQDVHIVLGGHYEGDVSRNALYRNPGSGNAWLTLLLEGRKANRSAIGARIRVTVETGRGERSVHRVVGSGGSFGANPLRAEIGLGPARSIRSVEVRWPGSGRVDEHGPLEMNRAYRIREGASAPEEAVVPVSSPPASSR